MMSKARMLAQLVLLGCAVGLSVQGQAEAGMLCVLMLWIIGIDGELREVHECIHKLGVITAMAGNAEFLEMVKKEVAKLDGQTPKDVVK